MIEDKRKIKEIYKCKYIVSDEALYPLQKWYNQLIDKTVCEITIADVLRMLRQREFIDLAMSMAVDILRENVYSGELYAGELVEKISQVDVSYLASYANDLKNILIVALEENMPYEWSYEGEMEEFKGTAMILLQEVLDQSRKKD